MKVIKHSRALTSAFVIAVGLLAVGCTADGQQPGDDASSGGLSLSEAGVSPEKLSIVECLRDRDWEIVIEADGWTAPGVSEAQASAYYADVAECTELNTIIRPLEDIPQEEWERAYADTVESAECLRGQGYDIPETPTFQAWQDSYFVDDGAGQWVPWGMVPVPSMSGSEFQELEAICPQVGL